MLLLSKVNLLSKKYLLSGEHLVFVAHLLYKKYLLSNMYLLSEEYLIFKIHLLYKKYLLCLCYCDSHFLTHFLPLYDKTHLRCRQKFRFYYLLTKYIWNASVIHMRCIYSEIVAFWHFVPKSDNTFIAVICSIFEVYLK